MNQFFGRWVSLLLVILSLSACSGDRVNAVTTVTLTGWQSSPTERQLLAQVLKDFEATHPHLKVKYETIADQYMDVIKTRLIGDAAPDVFYLDAFEAPLFMNHEVLEPLDDYITSDFNLNDFEPSLLEAFKAHGKTYGLPKDFSTLVLFYNKKSFAQARLMAPPQTWEDLRDYSQKLTRDRNRDGRPEQYGFGVIPELARQYFMLKAFGGKLVDEEGNATFATPESLRGLQLIVDQYRKERSSAQPSDVGASSTSEMFGQGKAAMAIEGSWAILYLKETFPKIDFATTEVPTIEGKAGTMAYTVAYVMNKQAKHKAAAWELISYLTGEDGMKAWAKAGLVLPTRKSVLSELGYDKNPLYAPFISSTDFATVWQEGENLPTIMTHFNNQFLSALLGEQPLEVAIKKAQNTANEEVQAANY